MYHYETAEKLLQSIIAHFRVLSGDEVGDSNRTWQATALVASHELKLLSKMLLDARDGRVKDGPVVFPSPDDYVRVVMERDEEHEQKGYDPVGGGGGHGRSDLPAGMRGDED